MPPLSPVSGAALQIRSRGRCLRGSRSRSPSLRCSTAHAAGVDDWRDEPQRHDPAELGPTGMAFKKPARLQLPIPKGLMAMPAIALQTYDYDTGHWKKVKVLNIDKKAGVVTAEVQHFSTYVLTPDIKVFDLQLGLGGLGSHCAESLIVRAGLLAKFSDVPALGVNGYTGTAIGKTVADVLAAMKDGEALQVYLRVHARAAAATGEQTGWMLAAATKTAGKFKVTVTSDSHAGPFLAVPAAPLAATDPELLGWLNGSRVDFVFGALGALSGGAVASAEASLYLGRPTARISRRPRARMHRQEDQPTKG